MIAELEAPLDGQWIVEMLRARMGAEVALGLSCVLLDRPLPRGPLRRRELWESCHSAANPAIAELMGEQLAEMLERGREPEFQKRTSHVMRGKPRGTLHATEPGASIDPKRTSAVAATDFEFWAEAGLVETDSNLSVHYDFPTLLREAIEERLAPTTRLEHA